MRNRLIPQIIKSKLNIDPTRQNIIDNIHIIKEQFNIEGKFSTFSSDKHIIEWDDNLNIIKEFNKNFESNKRCSINMVANHLQVNVNDINDEFYKTRINDIIEKFSLKKDCKLSIHDRGQITVVDYEGNIEKINMIGSNKFNVFLDGFIPISAEFNISGIDENKIENKIENNKLIFNKNKIFEGNNVNINININSNQEFELYLIIIKNNNVVDFKKLINENHIKIN